eukprot:gnl/MRDRNA2_/MRDRNA2_119445_c0_seq1.p1 gnl/MRDRNA2_/MRDRNA2_119445_c0~~gnl/MRDRNA2_/MRDRNA2_119445_c0_seq1.p1  ORF type:complete len:637 (+),score=95.40 gnl/MRDRNA2_/MRDRNA2_119445_c0_seq1:130-1911(+)
MAGQPSARPTAPVKQIYMPATTTGGYVNASIVPQGPCPTSGVQEIYVKKRIVSNSVPLAPPREQTLLDNTLLFLPRVAVHELGLEGNMNDKGDADKPLWFGRVWELRALLAEQYKGKMSKIKAASSLSAARKAELDKICANPVKRLLLKRLAATWKGASLRNRSYLSNVLDRLQDAYLRGTLIYAHGSGGCSWDNFRICRMIAGMNFLVIAPDGFAYPKNTAMGQMRNKDIQPLKKASDYVDYWADDLMYASKDSGQLTYSTKAETVLDDPDKWRSLYERCYQLRRSELHFTIRTLPTWIKCKGFFLGGTSEGAMTVARFDDQRYGSMVMGRFINSFSVEYCYFTPTPQDGEIGGQSSVPTLNIIGTKDQYFGAEDSVAKIVAEDTGHGYGNKGLLGHGYNTFVRQRLEDACVVLLEGGVHSPCLSHDNFLRQVFDVFFARPADIDKLDLIWSADPSMAELVQLRQTTRDDGSKTSVTFCFVPTMKFPQKMSLKEVRTKSLISKYNTDMKKELEEYEAEVKKRQDDATAMLDKVRANKKTHGGTGFKHEDPQSTYYSAGVHKTKKELNGKSVSIDMTRQKGNGSGMNGSGILT